MSLAAGFTLYALLPVAAASDGTIDTLRWIIEDAGCERAAVAMRVTDPDRVEIEVACRDTEPQPKGETP